jgi:hypothetical protein
MSESDSNSLLKRILGEEADPLIQMLRQPGADEALLKSRGIDSNAMLERAKAQISRAEKLTEHGINPPIPLEELTDAQFETLDIPTLEKYLAAGDVDVQRLITRTKQLLEDAKPKPAPGFFARLGTLLPRWPSAPVAGLAVSAMVLVAVGVGVLRLAPQSPTGPAVQLQEPALSVTLAETAQQKPLAKASPMPETLSAQAPELQMAESSALQGSAQVEIAAMPISDAADTAIATALEEETPFPVTEREEVVAVTEVTGAAEPTVAATQAPSEEEAPLSMSEEVTLAQNLVTQIETQSDAAPESQWALTAAPAEPTGKQTIEFIFEPGDTLSHGMARSGLPASLSMALAEKVGTDFWPGDKLIIYFENDEFEQLVVIRRKKEQTTVTADLKTSTAPIGTINMIEVTGEIKSSLYVALEKRLDANAAQRISWLLQNREVPLTTLPKGATFTVRIEHITDADGETLGYGEIKSVQLDAGSQGKFEMEGFREASKVNA